MIYYTKKEMDEERKQGQGFSELKEQEPIFSCFEQGKEQKQTFEDMVLKSIKYDRLEFETLGLERIIFARNTVEENWIKEADKAFNPKAIMDKKATTA